MNKSIDIVVYLLSFYFAGFDKEGSEKKREERGKGLSDGDRGSRRREVLILFCTLTTGPT